MIWIKRAYDDPQPQDGTRYLVDRLWPRGVSKRAAAIDEWPKEVAPSDELRRWFGHEPTRWDEFRRRYFAELDGKPEVWGPLAERARQGRITLVYGARDERHNNALALKEYLETRSSQA